MPMASGRGAEEVQMLRHRWGGSYSQAGGMLMMQLHGGQPEKVDGLRIPSSECQKF